MLDECEHLGAATIAATIGRVIRDAPSLLSVVIITNHDLDLPARFRNGARMRVLRAADLAFTVPEVQELFAQEQLMLARDEATTLAGWTEGTASAIRLAALASRDARDREQILAAAQRNDTSAHLVTFERVLERMAPDRRAFLIATAIVDPVSADLAAAITGTDDAAEHLADLARDDVFLEPVDGCPGWYAHRHPMRELLRAELAHRRPDDVVPLHRRAARWFDDAHCPGQAMDHAINGRDWPLVVRLVRTHWVAATLDELDAGLGDVPVPTSDGAAADIEHVLTASIIDLEHGDARAASARLDALAQRRPRPVRSADTELLEGLVRLRLAREGGDSGDIDEAAGSLSRWCWNHPGSGALVSDVSALAGRAHAEARLGAGDLDTATEILERVVDEATADGRDRQVADATASLAVITAAVGTRTASQRARRRAGRDVDPAFELRARRRALSLAICEYHADALPSAQHLATEARRSLRPGLYRETILPIVRARIATSIGDANAASTLLERATVPGREGLIAATCDALGLPRPDPHPEPNPTHPYVRVMEYLTEADHTFTRHDYDRTWPALEHALGLVERNSFCPAFVDSGLRVRPLLQTYIAQARPLGQVAWQLLQRLPAEAADGDTPVVESLTERELAVLRHLPTMMSNREIATEMHFSVNTVKTHLKAIYRKLGVSRRRDAVEHARARSLL